MKLEIKNQENYSASYVTIKNVIDLEGCDNITHTTILGNSIVVGKDIKVGDRGVFFPVECKISEEFLSNNNLYRHSEKNVDKEKKAFFEDTGRVRCVKLRGFKSEGFFVPLCYFSYLDISEDVWEKIKENTSFDTIDGNEICRKYVVKRKGKSGIGSYNKKKRKLEESRIIDTYWNFHEDTSQLYRNLHKIDPESYIDISYKMHGTSLCSGHIKVKKKLSFIERSLQLLGINIIDTEYDYVWSSRKVIKNKNFNNKTINNYYDLDIWGLANEKIKHALQKGMMIYSEIVGFLPNGQEIQTGYDYGCLPEEFSVYVYRITYTNEDGKVFEFSPKQVREYCKLFDIKSVPEMYYGKVIDLYKELCSKYDKELDGRFDNNTFLELLKLKYNDKDCYMCRNKVPEEGVVLRIDKNDIDSYKVKSNRFYEFETKMLDKGEENIEDSQEEIGV